MIRDAYGLNSEAAVIRVALAQGVTLEDLARKIGVTLP